MWVVHLCNRKHFVVIGMRPVRVWGRDMESPPPHPSFILNKVSFRPKSSDQLVPLFGIFNSRNSIFMF